MALWGGRFESGVAQQAAVFGASLPIDRFLYRQDIAGSKAHALMLAHQGILSSEDADLIVEHLDAIAQDIASGALTFDIADEDIHMAVESELTRRIGEPGKRLHTARSRNDQVATDARLAAKALVDKLMQACLEIRRALVFVATEHQDTLLPGYTHLQHAQPVSYAHHLLAYAWMFARDFKRMEAAFCAADACPLGAAALAGTSYPIDREMTAKTLGFSSVIENSMDAVSDRDFLLDLHFACSTAALHLSRLAEEIVLWSSSEFGFIELSDSFSTGSSIMPQKKNPDFAELIRGKTGRVFGNLTQLLVTCKGLPLAYNKDLQEDKEGMLDSAHTTAACLEIMAEMLKTLTVRADQMASACEQGYLAATDIADYLVGRGMPFREAHSVVGHLVLECEKRSCTLSELTLEDFQQASPLFDADILGALDTQAVVEARTSQGGTAHAAVAHQLELVRCGIEQDTAIMSHHQGIVEMGSIGSLDPLMK